MKKDQELKNCPICGNDAKICQDYKLAKYDIKCTVCGISTCLYDTKLIAAGAWNTRHFEELLMNELTLTRNALVGLVEVYQDVVKLLRDKSAKDSPIEAQKFSEIHKNIISVKPKHLAQALIETLRKNKKR